MTLRELYQAIDGDYDQAISVLRLEKLIDKHIRKLPENGVMEGLLAAGQSMDPTQLFDAAHAMKGVCANLGLKRLVEAVSEITEEFRPGNTRKLSDEDVNERIEAIRRMYDNTTGKIRQYAESCNT